jgi:hypothetical protein
MSPAQLEREVQRLQAQVDRLSAKVPVRRETSAAGAETPTIYEIADGETITALNRIGIVRITSEIDGGDLPTVTIPAEVPDGGTYVVPANPTPAGLPSGVGVGRRIGSESYGFILNDSRASIVWDVVQADRCWTPETVTIDKAQGAKTARWIFHLIRHQL